MSDRMKASNDTRWWTLWIGGEKRRFRSLDRAHDAYADACLRMGAALVSLVDEHGEPPVIVGQ